MQSVREDYEKQGFLLLENAIEGSAVGSLIRQLSILEEGGNRYGVRDLMYRVPYVWQLATSDPLLTIARGLLGDRAKPVRSVFFDKVPDANWNVAWHQDTSIALEARHEIPGFGPWSEKHGVVHVEPPEEYLANTLTLRVHLDVSDISTGGLRVVPGTHKNGRLPSAEILKIVQKSEVVECTARPGDVLLMNPLLFHSSRKAIQPSHRRIVHIEYSAMELPEPLRWYEGATDKSGSN